MLFHPYWTSLLKLSWASLCAFSLQLSISSTVFQTVNVDGVSTKRQAFALRQRIYEMVNSWIGARFNSFVKSAYVVFLVGVQWTFVELSSHPDSYCSCEPSLSKSLFFSKRKHLSFVLCHDSYYHVPMNLCHLVRSSFVQVFSIISRTWLLKCWIEIQYIEIQCKLYISS